jgi:serine/threonine protein kinase
MGAALNYLHTGFSPPLIHRDIKATNILLTRKKDAKIADFGLARPLSTESKTHTNTTPGGTFGYMDPVYAQHLALVHLP